MCGVQVVTYIARGSGFVGRKLAHVAGGGMPLPLDLEFYVKLLQQYEQVMMFLSWNLERVEPNPAQLEVRF